MIRKRKQPSPEDTHLVFGELAEVDSALESVQIDAVDDRKWLQEHPDQKDRRRLPSTREIIAFNLPPGISVVVFRGPDGS